MLLDDDDGLILDDDDGILLDDDDGILLDDDDGILLDDEGILLDGEGILLDGDNNGAEDGADDGDSQPADISPATAEPNPARPPTPTDLPDGWVVHWEQTRESYYFEYVATRETCWERPTGPPASVSAAASPLVPAAHVTAPQVPDGWTAHYDTTQATYFYQNTATGETTWNLPTS